MLALWWQDTPSVVSQADWLTDAGRIAGPLSGYACAVLVTLMARVPALEHGVGSDRVARWHAMAGRWTVCLLVAHVVLIVWGYTVQGHASVRSAATAPPSPRCAPAHACGPKGLTGR